jgi:hypothetical protein
MYGQGQAGTARADEQPMPPIEPISSVHQNTITMLIDANNALSQLLNKVRGSQPEKTNELAKMPEKHVLGDSRAIRELAGAVYEKANELHRYIGHDKQ